MSRLENKPEEIQPNTYYSDFQDRLTISVSHRLDADTAVELADRSAETDIVIYFPEDHYKRFPDSKSARRWSEAEPALSVYTLKLARTANLAGIIWISESGSERIAGVDRMFNLRMYSPTDGMNEHELTIGFGNAVLSDDERVNDGDLGAIINRDNGKDRRVHEDLGFREIARIKPSDTQIKLARAGFLSRAYGSTKS